MNQMKIACKNCVFSRAKEFKSSITFFVSPFIDFQMVNLLTFKTVTSLFIASLRTMCTMRNTM